MGILNGVFSMLMMSLWRVCCLKTVWNHPNPSKAFISALQWLIYILGVPFCLFFLYIYTPLFSSFPHPPTICSNLSKIFLRRSGCGLFFELCDIERSLLNSCQAFRTLSGEVSTLTWGIAFYNVLYFYRVSVLGQSWIRSCLAWQCNLGYKSYESVCSD